MIVLDDKADTTHRAELELGPPIVGGIVRWCSSTLITSADHNSEGGCLRRVFFERVLGRERVTTAAMTAGVGMHKEIETYLATGQLVLGPVAMAGRHFIPEPGPGLSVEQPIIVGSNGEIRGVYLRCAGVPVAGHVDLYNHRGEYIDAEGELRRDPPNTLETKDWKSTSDLKWAKTAEQIAATIQMTTYAMAGFRLWPHYEHSRQTHVYFQREGRPQAVLATSRRDRRQIEQRWEYAESVMRRVIDAARETDPNKVEANTRACRAYNRDCPHLDVCEAGKAAREFNSLDEMFGSRMAERVLARMQGLPVDDGYSELEVPLDVFSTLEGATMGLFDVVKTGGAQASVTPITPPEGVGVSISIDDLVAEEAAARAALDPPAPAPLPPTGEFTQAIGVICSAPLGFPKLIGRAAIMFGTLNKHELKAGMEIAASGKLEKLAPIEDPDAVVALGVEIRKKFPTQGPADVSKMETAAAKKVERIEPAIAILPPDAPASNPALAAVPVEGLDNAKARELAALTTTEIPGLAESVAAAGVLPAAGTTDLFGSATVTTTAAPAASASIGVPIPNPPETTAIPAVADPAPAGDNGKASTTATAGTEAAAPKRRAPKKPKPADATATVTQSTIADKPEGTEVKIWNDTAIEIFADVTTDGLEAESLAPYIRQLCATLEAEFKVADVRTASKESGLGYDKWRGAVAALARRHPPQPGRYVVDTRGDEIAEIVVVALKAAAVESGGFVVRGIA